MIRLLQQTHSCAFTLFYVYKQASTLRCCCTVARRATLSPLWLLFVMSSLSVQPPPTQCFTCSTCRNRLVPGDRFHYINGSLFCEHDRPTALINGHLSSLQTNPLLSDQKVRAPPCPPRMMERAPSSGSLWSDLKTDNLKARYESPKARHQSVRVISRKKENICNSCADIFLPLVSMSSI